MRLQNKVELGMKNLGSGFVLVSRGVVAELALEACLPLSPLNFGDADDLGFAECVEAVDEGDADVDFGGLAVRVSCGEALAECLQAAHLCLDPAPGVVSCPALPEGPTVVSGGAQGFISDLRSRTSSFHGRPFLRIGIIGRASRSMMAEWQRRVS